MLRFLRLGGTALAFTLFGLGGMLVSLTWFNLVPLVIADRSRRIRHSRRVIAVLFRLFLRICALMRLYDCRPRGLEPLRAARGLVLVANHPTLIDVVMLAAFLPGINCVVKGRLARNPFTRGMVRAAGYIVNDSQEQFLSGCAAALAAGENVLIFPEGTRSEPGKPLHLKRGAAQLCIRYGYNLQCLKIACSVPFLTKHYPWYSIPETVPMLRVEPGALIAVASFGRGDDEPPSLAARRLNAEILKQLECSQNHG